jgi:uncharacterized protein with FMN-binding domain
MKRVLFAITGTVLGLVALLSFKTKSPVVSSAALPSGSTSTTSVAAPSSNASSSSAAKRATSSSSAASAKTYTGQAIQTQYGIVQVAVTATGSHIESVKFVQLTAFDQRSAEINAAAGPTLIQETLSAQSAQIDTVSGATYTSDGYLHSLQSALDQAGI